MLRSRESLLGPRLRFSRPASLFCGDDCNGHFLGFREGSERETDTIEVAANQWPRIWSKQ